MNYDIGTVVPRLSAFQGALSCEPDIYPDLSKLTFDHLPLVLLALMNLGVRSFGELTSYLNDHGASFDSEDVRSVLSRFEVSANGTSAGLWRGNANVGFIPAVSVTS